MPIQRFLCDLISSSSHNELLLPVPLYLFTFFWLPSLVRRRVPCDTGASASLPLIQVLHKFFWLHHQSLCILKIWYSFCPGAGVAACFPSGKTWLSTCHCNEKYLKESFIPLSPNYRMWGIVPSLHSITCML